MALVNLKQVALMALLGMFFIWILRLDSGANNSDGKTRELAAIDLPVVANKDGWQGDKLRERLTVFAPPNKPPPKAEKVVATTPKPTVPKPKPIDKTLKPMFSQLDEDHQVGLLAIVQDNDGKFAILQKINFASKETENIKVKDTALFSGFNLGINSQTQVVLKNANREILLNLFNPRNT